MSKPFRDTAIGKFLATKGFSDIVNTVGTFVPGVQILNDVKDAVLGAPAEKQLTPEDKQTFLDLHKAQMEELDAQLGDVANARNREIEIAKTPKKDWMMATAGIIGLLIFLTVVYALLFITIPASNKEIFVNLLGMVEGVILSIYTYYYGSSKGSADKTDLLKEKANVS